MANLITNANFDVPYLMIKPVRTCVSAKRRIDKNLMTFVLALDLIGDDRLIRIGRRRFDVGVVPVSHVFEVVVRTLQNPDPKNCVLYSYKMY